MHSSMTFPICNSETGLPWSGKSQGKTKIFDGQGKVRKFLKSQGKSLVLSKSVKSQGIYSS